VTGIITELVNAVHYVTDSQMICSHFWFGLVHTVNCTANTTVNL